MSFNWDEFHKLAVELQKRSDQASARTSISRAYYSVVHWAKQSAMNKHPSFKTTREKFHEEVWAWYKDRTIEDLQEAGEIGAGLRRSRNRADYDHGIECDSDAAQRALNDAERLRELIKNGINSMPK